MASKSPTTTIGAANVGPWNCIPAHYHNTNGTRAYLPIVTDLTSDSTKIEFVPVQGLRVQGHLFLGGITDGDLWDSASVRRPPGGLVSCAWIPFDDDSADDFNCVRCESSSSIRFSGGGVTGSGWVITWSRGQAHGRTGSGNVSENKTNQFRVPAGRIPLAVTPSGAYVASGTTYGAGENRIKFENPESLKQHTFYFADIDDDDTFDASSSTPCPRGVVAAAWIADDAASGANGDIINTRVTGSQSIHFKSAFGNRNGWLAVWTRG